MRIQIIGYSGSGKSTLARRLGELYGLPVLHLDAVQFYGNWNERSLEEQNALVQKFLEKNEGWVIDGNYARVCPQRFAMADTCIFSGFRTRALPGRLPAPLAEVQGKGAALAGMRRKIRRGILLVDHAQGAHKSPACQTRGTPCRGKKGHSPSHAPSGGRISGVSFL